MTWLVVYRYSHLLYSEVQLYHEVTLPTMHDSQMQWGGVFTLRIEAVDVDVGAVAQHLHDIQVAGVSCRVQSCVASV